MMRPALFACLGLAATAGLTGCNLTDALDPYGPGGFDATFANAYCSFYFDCCNAAERSRLNITTIGANAISNKEECLEEAAKFFRPTTQLYEESEAAGRSQWDRARAQACMANYETGAAECNAETFYKGFEDDDCGEPVTGLVEDGGDCYGDYECATDGAVCVIDEGDADDVIVTYKGECTDPLEEGDDCVGEDVPCAPGLYCDFAADECTEYAGVGDSCDNGEICDPQTSYCELDLDTFDQTCAGLKDIGETCDFSFECKSSICDTTCQANLEDPDVDIEYDLCVGNAG